MDWTFFLIKTIFAVIVLNGALVIVAFLVYFERKALARFQVRMGPNRAGPFGLLQSFADLLKGMKKEYIEPSQVDKPLFRIAPVVAAGAAISMLAVLPFGPSSQQPGHIDLFGQRIDWFIADVNIGLLLILALSSLGVYGVLMAGWGSNSKYPLLSSLRATSQVISYEITLGISLVGVFLLSGSISLVDINTAQHPSLHQVGAPGIPFILLQPVAFITFFVSALAETGRVPFDLIEAEQELIAGYHAEYSGTRFLLFQMAEYLAMTTMSFIAAVTFLGGWVSPLAWALDGTSIPFISGLLGSGAHWIFVKTGLFIFLFFWVRWTLPRFRYDQLMGLCWKVLLPIVLGNIMVLSVLRFIFFPPGQPLADNHLAWWIIAGIEIVLALGLVVLLSRWASRSWFGRAERPALVGRQVILVQNVGPGRGTIEGTAVTLSSGSAPEQSIARQP